MERRDGVGERSGLSDELCLCVATMQMLADNQKQYRRD